MFFFQILNSKKKNCQILRFSFKAELASIHNSEEEQFIETFIRESTDSRSAIYWLGGTWNDESWYWVDNSTETFSGLSLILCILHILYYHIYDISFSLLYSVVSNRRHKCVTVQRHLSRNQLAIVTACQSA